MYITMIIFDNQGVVVLQCQDRFVNNKLVGYVSRPQHKLCCSITALTGVFNYLYADIVGIKTSFELASILKIPIDDIGTTIDPSNSDIMDWFRTIVFELGLNGTCDFFLRDNDIDDLNYNLKSYTKIKETIKCKNNALIYHMDNHYTLIVGFFDSARDSKEVYQPNTSLDWYIKSLDWWIILGEHYCKFDPIWSILFRDLSKDIKDNDWHCILRFSNE